MLKNQHGVQPLFEDISYSTALQIYQFYSKKNNCENSKIAINKTKIPAITKLLLSFKHILAYVQTYDCFESLNRVCIVQVKN